MTTVTEAAKRLGLDLHPLEQSDLATLKRDPVLAQQFARRLAAVAKEITPGVAWSVEDLRDVIEAAFQVAPPEAGRLVEGRYLRKRVRELCAHAERYGETFALVVIRLAPEPEEGAYVRLAEELGGKLRKADLMALYKRRLALLLPRMAPSGIDPLLRRALASVDAHVKTRVVLGTPHAVYPSSEFGDTQSVLDWLEDELRPVS